MDLGLSPTGESRRAGAGVLPCRRCERGPSVSLVGPASQLEPGRGHGSPWDRVKHVDLGLPMGQAGGPVPVLRQTTLGSRKGRSGGGAGPTGGCLRHSAYTQECWWLGKCSGWFGPLLRDFPPWSHDRHLAIITKMTLSNFFPLPAMLLVATKAGKGHCDPKGALPPPGPYPQVLPPCVRAHLSASLTGTFAAPPSAGERALPSHPRTAPLQVPVSVTQATKPSLISQLRLNTLISKHLRNFLCFLFLEFNGLHLALHRYICKYPTACSLQRPRLVYIHILPTSRTDWVNES